MVLYALRLVRYVYVNEKEGAYEEGEALVGVCVFAGFFAAVVIVGRGVGTGERLTG